jgi:hypothetical protein
MREGRKGAARRPGRTGPIQGLFGGAGDWPGRWESMSPGVTRLKLNHMSNQQQFMLCFCLLLPCVSTVLPSQRPCPGPHVSPCPSQSRMQAALTTNRRLTESRLLLTRSPPPKKGNQGHSQQCQQDSGYQTGRLGLLTSRPVGASTPTSQGCPGSWTACCTPGVAQFAGNPKKSI